MTQVISEYPLKPEDLSYACLVESHAALRHCVAQQISSQSEETCGRDPYRTVATFFSLMQLMGMQRIQCVRHLNLCTDFTRSVPLGSQFKTSLYRRSQSSPEIKLYHYCIGVISDLKVDFQNKKQPYIYDRYLLYFIYKLFSRDVIFSFLSSNIVCVLNWRGLHKI